VSGYPTACGGCCPQSSDLLPHRITVSNAGAGLYGDDGVTQDEYTDVYVNPYGGEVSVRALETTSVASN